MVIETIGRRLRLAVVGGGPGSVIGEVHRIAGRGLDGYYDVVAATLSSDPERAHRAGIAIGVPEDRAYPSAQALLPHALLHGLPDGATSPGHGPRRGHWAHPPG
jgi:hypothetical protein